MGKLIYGSTRSIDCDDRTLSHLQVVILAKLRRGEPFYFSWKDDASVGSGRTAIWLAPNVSLHFKYDSSRFPAINVAWLTALAASSNSVGGLQLVPEPAEAKADDGADGGSSGDIPSVKTSTLRVRPGA